MGARGTSATAPPRGRILRLSERPGLILLLVAALVAGVYLMPELGLGPAGGGGGGDRGRSTPTHGCENARDEPREDVRAAERATLCLLNAERRAKGLRPLRADPRLRAAAVRHSKDMLERGFFEHVSPDGLDHHDRILRARYRPALAGGATGENLATGEREASTPAVIVDGWMHSPGHRRNILRRRFAEIGIGIVPRSDRGERGGTYTTTFGGPPPG